MSPSWLSSSITYQIFTGRWQADISNGSIVKQDTFQTLKKHNWPRLKDLGINTLYFLGIWDSRGPIIVQEEKGINLYGQQPRIPSVFAITDHTSFHPDLGTSEDFQNLLEHLHHLNFKIIVDFVPNHTSTVHPWLTDHPDYYYQDNSNFIAEFSGDVYKLNYKNPQVRDRMLQVIETIFSYGVDGIRCDMAHFIPNDFWSFAISEIKNSYPQAAFIAESYPESPFDYSRIHGLFQAGFDAVYDRQLYKLMHELPHNHDNLHYIFEHLKTLKQNFSTTIEHSNNEAIETFPVHFFANHDEGPPSFSPPYQGGAGGSNSQKSEVRSQMLSLILFTPGIPFLYNGILLGLDHRLAHHWFEPLPSHLLETQNPLQQELQDLFHLRQQRHPQGVYSEHFQVEIADNQLILKNQDHQGQEYQLTVKLNSI